MFGGSKFPHQVVPLDIIKHCLLHVQSALLGWLSRFSGQMQILNGL